jgi:hypothetical protein
MITGDERHVNIQCHQTECRYLVHRCCGLIADLSSWTAFSLLVVAIIGELQSCGVNVSDREQCAFHFLETFSWKTGFGEPAISTYVMLGIDASRLRSRDRGIDQATEK